MLCRLTEVCLGGDGEAGRGEGQPGEQRGERVEGGRVGEGEGQQVAVRLRQRPRNLRGLARLQVIRSYLRLLSPYRVS